MTYPDIKGLPSGWTVIKFHNSMKYPRDAVVLCERTELSPYDTRFVCWFVNMIEGGCHLGQYTDEEDKARMYFAERVGRMN